ncbi:type II toxin-antitoxin system antitoxin DNA ADP-ribosyl glycohydrolase DarG [Lysinibacillus xylanilyticus]|uniref:Macro domain-containing protein n=1 Tax=Lysinibacillus xylanilyticus TaxID=582475 RepID=A0ABV3VQT6_9BACI
MIKFVKGNLFDSDAEALVNTVNCVGVMGKGVALEVKKKHPNVYKVYKKACDIGQIKPGKILTVPTENLIGTQYIVNFPTKRHWRANSKIEDIKLGLPALVQEIKDLKLKSIAIPPLGCGNGGLDWNEVRPIIVDALSKVEDVDITIYEPQGTNKVESNNNSKDYVKKVNKLRAEESATNKVESYNKPMVDRNNKGQKPRLTEGRRALLTLLSLYEKEKFVITINEIHNLAYILQTAGTPLRLNFEKTEKGFFSNELNLVLLKLNNYYLEAYSLPGKNSLVRIKDDQLKMASSSEDHDLLKYRIDLLINSINGYKSEVGLELFSIVLSEMKELVSFSDYDLLLERVLDSDLKHKSIFKKSDVEEIYLKIKKSDIFFNG